MSEINNFLGQKNMERKAKINDNWYLKMLKSIFKCNVAQQNLDSILNDKFNLMNKNTIAEAEKRLLELKREMEKRSIILQQVGFQEFSRTCFTCSNIEFCYCTAAIDDKEFSDYTHLDSLECKNYKGV